MKIVFMGTPDFAAGILNAIVKAGYDVVGVVTQPDKPKGRRKEPVACPVKEVALREGLRVYQPQRVRNPEAVSEIESMGADLIVVAAFGQIIPKEILDLPKFGCINVHASLLPAYRGAAPIQQAILDGCSVTGVTIMQMDVGLDTGDIISMREIPIEDTDTGGSLFDKLAALGAELLVETLPSIENGTAVRTPQPEESLHLHRGQVPLHILTARRSRSGAQRSLRKRAVLLPENSGSVTEKCSFRQAQGRSFPAKCRSKVSAAWRLMISSADIRLRTIV